MKVLIIGKTGQLARELLKTAPPGVEAIALDRAALELTDSSAVARSIAGELPKVVINAAAYTAVDLAESEVQRAYSINDQAVGAMAQTCSERGIRLVHLSTDFVFDGTVGRPYRPHDAPSPINVYGASKLAGEGRVLATRGLDWRIVRTAWVYSSAGRNFMLTMLRLFRERERVQVVADQVGTPTSASSLAQCVWRAAADEGGSDIMHFTDAGVASWYDFAVAIYEEAKTLGLIAREVDILPVTSAEYPTQARRPPYSVLDKGQTLRRLGLTPVHWRIKLREVLKELTA